MDFYVIPFIAAVTSPRHIYELKSRKERLRLVYPAQPCPPFGQCPKGHFTATYYVILKSQKNPNSVPIESLKQAPYQRQPATSSSGGRRSCCSSRQVHAENIILDNLSKFRHGKSFSAVSSIMITNFVFGINDIAMPCPGSLFRVFLAARTLG